MTKKKLSIRKHEKKIDIISNKDIRLNKYKYLNIIRI